MKFLLVLLVVLVGGWLLFGRQRKARVDRKPAPGKVPAADTVSMVACVHCGVHLPAAELLLDAAGRPYCSDAHRLAGPR